MSTRLFPRLRGSKTMKYYVSFHQNFVDIRSFLQGLKNSAFNSNISLADFKTATVHSFMLEGMLYYPVTIGLGNGGGTIGFLKAKVSTNDSIDPSRLYWLDSEDKLKGIGLKLSPQSIKTLKSVAANNTAFTDQHSWTTRGFKCKSEDVIKSLVMGYYAINESREMLENLAYNDYNLQYLVRDKKTPLPTVYAKLTAHFESDVKSHWMSQSIGQRLSHALIRTAKAVDDTYVLKWRRPNKNSKWPYTLDHHWFCSQESPIATAHHSFSALMGRNANRDQLMMTLPIFTNIRQLEIARKITEYFYSNIQNILKKDSSNCGTYFSMVNDFEWPSGRYGRRKMTADLFPIKACLAMGVTPTFNQDGTFNKFVPIANTLLDNPETLYIEMEADDLGKRKPDVTLMLGYSIGLLSVETLELLLGPILVNKARLIDDPHRIQLQISRNIVCCVPVTTAKNSLAASLMKYDVYLDKVKHPIDDADIMEHSLEEHIANQVSV